MQPEPGDGTAVVDCARCGASTEEVIEAQRGAFAGELLCPDCLLCEDDVTYNAEFCAGADDTALPEEREASE